ncbi:MAG TPA: lamin tail domain-containing protein [Polyangia bacterium]
MRPFRYLALCCAGLACTPATDLQKEQAAGPNPEATGGSLPSSAPEPQSGDLVDPPSGSTDLPINLAAIVVRFKEQVQSAGAALPFMLRPATGDGMALSLGAGVPCLGSCYQLQPGGQLLPSTLYTVEVLPNALQFLDGKPTPGGSAGSFTTGAQADPFAPRIEAFTVQAAEGCLSAHVGADESVRAEIAVVAGDGQALLSTDTFASTLDFAQRLPELPTGMRAEALLRVFDRAGNSAASTPIAVDLPPRLPYLAITEVLANPAGSENTQEFVEIYNAGSEAEALGGLLLADKSGSDALPDASLPAGAFAMVVPENYDAADGKDPPPRDGTLVVRVPGRLAGDGLTNAGEPVHLLTASGLIISQYGGWVDVSATSWSGKSVKRASPGACDGADAWSKTPSPPTPGW